MPDAFEGGANSWHPFEDNRHAFVFNGKRADVFLKREGDFFICEGDLKLNNNRLLTKFTQKCDKTLKIYKN